MLWVVENLQEELFRAQEYRLQAERRQHQHRATITTLQVSCTVFNNANCSQESMANYARHKQGHFEVADSPGADLLCTKTVAFLVNIISTRSCIVLQHFVTCKQ